jgi:hypothetical protein
MQTNTVLAIACTACLVTIGCGDDRRADSTTSHDADAALDSRDARVQVSADAALDSRDAHVQVSADAARLSTDSGRDAMASTDAAQASDASHHDAQVADAANLLAAGFAWNELRGSQVGIAATDRWVRETLPATKKKRTAVAES